MKKALLIDLDGVLRIGNEPANGCKVFLKNISEANINACILSNSSLYTSDQIHQFFIDNSIELCIPIITAVDTAVKYTLEKYNKVAVYASSIIVNLLENKLEYDNPEAVLIGDIGDSWNFNIMQKIFENINNGAELIAIHKNKYWNNPNLGIQLDAGPFINGIEFATSKTATLIGKPSPVYFYSALEIINSKIDDSFLMLGDDLVSDIEGAKNIGAETILIFTGKTKYPLQIKYNHIVDHKVKNLCEASDKIIDIIKGKN